LVSQLSEDLLLCSSYLPLGVPNGLLLHAIKQFSGAVAREEEDLCKGSLARTIFHFVFVFIYFIFACIILSKIQKNSFLYSCLYLHAFSFARMSNPEVKVRTFKQQGGESLKDAWYRISNAYHSILSRWATKLVHQHNFFYRLLFSTYLFPINKYIINIY
jgi:hypothetical protein